MSIFNIPSFYPTPENLIEKMMSKVKMRYGNVLEPSAGKGDIVDHIKMISRHRFKISTIEKDYNLRSILRGKKYNVIDSDFLSFSGPDKFDLIIANPPFDEGDKHLLKAIDIMYNGQIVFLLNAETLKNPFSNIRKELVNKLNELDAEIEFISNAFIDAERKTAVEIALISIIIKNNVEDDLFKNCDKVEEFKEKVNQSSEVALKNDITTLVKTFNDTLNNCIKTIVNFYENYGNVSNYMTLNIKGEEENFSSQNLTSLMQEKVNFVARNIRERYWRKILKLKEVKNRMTEKRLNEFNVLLTSQCYMDFTEKNIHEFILNLIHGYDDMLTEAVIDIFDRMTRRHSYDEEYAMKNVHLYNGWKSNNCFKVNKKVVLLPPGAYSGCSFYEWGRWQINWGTKNYLNDIDIVMNYFDGKKEYLSIVDAIESSFKDDKTSKIESTYFTITVYKKGTIHLVFKDENILRRFNVAASIGKGWLPKGYGKTQFNLLTSEEQEIVKSFEGKKVYENNIIENVFSISLNKNLMLTD